jgi:hypothetical protein
MQENHVDEKKGNIAERGDCSNSYQYVVGRGSGMELLLIDKIFQVSISILSK